jgi:hypothetical protein
MRAASAACSTVAPGNRSRPRQRPPPSTRARTPRPVPQIIIRRQTLNGSSKVIGWSSAAGAENLTAAPRTHRTENLTCSPSMCGATCSVVPIVPDSADGQLAADASRARWPGAFLVRVYPARRQVRARRRRRADRRQRRRGTRSPDSQARRAVSVGDGHIGRPGAGVAGMIPGPEKPWMVVSSGAAQWSAKASGSQSDDCARSNSAQAGESVGRPWPPRCVRHRRISAYPASYRPARRTPSRRGEQRHVHTAATNPSAGPVTCSLGP